MWNTGRYNRQSGFMHGRYAAYKKKCKQWGIKMPLTFTEFLPFLHATDEAILKSHFPLTV